MFTRTRSHQHQVEGYIVIVVLLMAAVLLMLGLAFAARTTEQVFLSTQEEDTTRVFNVAESGIDRALYNLDTNTSLTPAGQVSFTQNINESDVTVTSVDDPNASIIVEQGQTLTLKPSAAGTVGSLKWTTTNATSGCPALLITLYRGTSAYHASFNSAYNGSNCAGRTLAHTPIPAITGYSVSSNTHTLSLSATNAPSTYFGVSALGPNDMIRVTPLYGPVTFEQVQAKRITSTATDARDSGATETRKIEVTRTEPGPPSVFDYAVFSGGDLVKD